MIVHPPYQTRFLTPLLAGALLLGACESDTDRVPSASAQAALVQYQSCGELEQDLKQMYLEELDARIEQMQDSRYWYGYGPATDAEAGANGDDGTSGGQERTEGEDYSGTNNQEEGVDEGDFVKTDGFHIYTLNGNRLHIFGVPAFGDLLPESVTEIEGYPQEMLVHKAAQRVVVFSAIDVYSLPANHPLRAALGITDDYGSWWRVSSVSKLTILDVSNPQAPALVRELFFEGWYSTARMVGTSVRLGAYGWIYIPGLDDYWWYYDGSQDAEALRAQARDRINGLSLADIIPRAYERLPNGSFRAIDHTGEACRSFYRPEDSAGRGITSLISFDMTAAEVEFDADHIMTNYPTIYASRDRMYVADSAWDWWWFWVYEDADLDDMTNIHAFDTSQPGQAVYIGSGRVAGQLHNQFSLSEYEGSLRVSTTVNRWNRWWEEDPPLADNRVFVLQEQDDELAIVGQVDGIAPGESIFAVRFDGPRGYLVTFRNIDPLFTLDLSDPEHPTVVGELTMPGVSTYLHPTGDDQLLTIGMGGDENGLNWRTQISLFTVADFAHPAQQDVQDIAMVDGWSWSEAQYNHKAFQFWEPKELLAVPLSSYRYWDNADGTWGYEWTSTLQLVKVDLDAGDLSIYGEIDHSDLYNSDPERYWYWTDVRRSIFMGDFIYAISDAGITVHRASDLGRVAVQTLPGYTPGYYYWWW